MYSPSAQGRGDLPREPLQLRGQEGGVSRHDDDDRTRRSALRIVMR